MNFVRGTFADPFGYLAVRREERELLRWYESLLDNAFDMFNNSEHEKAIQLCDLSDSIRGYEHIKSKNIALAKEKAKQLMAL